MTRGKVECDCSAALYRLVLRATVTQQAGLRCTDKDDDGAVIKPAFIARIQQRNRHGKSLRVQSGARDVYTGCVRLIRDILTTSVFHAATRDDDVYLLRKSYRSHFPLSDLFRE